MNAIMKKWLCALIAAAALAAHAAPQAASSEQTASAAGEAAASETAASAVSSKNEAAEIQTAEVPKILSPVYWVQDVQSGVVLAEQEGQRAIEPASFSKLMTAFLVFQALEDGRLKKEQQITPSENAWRAEGARMFLKRGQAVSVEKLLQGLAAVQANDAAVALAEAVAGSEAEFVKQMNAEAQRLGMKQTKFANATGKPADGQQTDAADLAKLGVEILQRYEQYLPLFSAKSFKFNQIEQPNSNLLLFRDSDVDGLMTAQDSDGGWNLLAASKRHGRRVLVLVAGADSEEMRTAESSRLLNWALQAFDTVQAYEAGEVLSKVKVYKGQARELGVGADGAVFLTIPRGEGQNLKPVLETEQPVLAPVAKGQVLGKLKIVHQDKVLVEKDVVALAAVEKAGWFGSLIDDIVLWFKSLIN
ncbi:MAG: D-alanyl-D-alanine carboxypeptidase family protein [Neisseria sp.]|nr:D-alanyl-D-alanine carboxypeptidase family protein [Neisseria sp.]